MQVSVTAKDVALRIKNDLSFAEEVLMELKEIERQENTSTGMGASEHTDAFQVKSGCHLKVTAL